MKSAVERAEALWAKLPASAQTALDLNYGRSSCSANPSGTGKAKWLHDTAGSFREHARHQCHLCAETIDATELENESPEASLYMRENCHAAAVNAPAPGERP